MRLKVSIIVDLDTTDVDIMDMSTEILQEAKLILDSAIDFGTENEIMITPIG